MATIVPIPVAPAVQSRPYRGSDPIRDRIRAGMRVVRRMFDEIWPKEWERMREAHRRAVRIAAAEAKERDAAIEASVGAMCSADIRRLRCSG